MDLLPVNYLAVIISAILYVAIGWVWYSIFCKCCTHVTDSMAEQCDMSKEECKKHMPRRILGTFIIGLITAYILAQFITHLHANTAWQGISVAFFAWLGFVLPSSFSGVLWGKWQIKSYLVYIGNMLVTLAAIGALLATWNITLG